MRNVLIVFSLALAVFFGYMAFSYNDRANSSTALLDEERFKRLSVEEELNATKEIVANRENEIQRLNQKSQTLEQLVEQTKLINRDLKTRLNKAEEFQQSLEQKILELQKISFSKTQATEQTAE